VLVPDIDILTDTRYPVRSQDCKRDLLYHDYKLKEFFLFAFSFSVQVYTTSQHQVEVTFTGHLPTPRVQVEVVISRQPPATKKLVSSRDLGKFTEERS